MVVRYYILRVYYVRSPGMMRAWLTPNQVRAWLNAKVSFFNSRSLKSYYSYKILQLIQVERGCISSGRFSHGLQHLPEVRWHTSAS